MRDDLDQIRDLLIQRLEEEGQEYDRVEIVEDGLVIHSKDGEAMKVKVESEAETLQRILERQERERREREQMPFMLSAPGLGMAAAAAQAKPWKYGGHNNGIYGHLKRQKAKAKRRKMKKHKKRGR